MTEYSSWVQTSSLSVCAVSSCDRHRAPSVEFSKSLNVGMSVSTAGKVRLTVYVTPDTRHTTASSTKQQRKWAGYKAIITMQAIHNWPNKTYCISSYTAMSHHCTYTDWQKIWVRSKRSITSQYYKAIIKTWASKPHRTQVAQLSPWFKIVDLFIVKNINYYSKR